MTPPALPDACMTDSDGQPSLAGSACLDCGMLLFPVAPVCPGCMGEKLELRGLAREGSIYSLTTMHVGPKNWSLPCTVGYVDLADGVRVFAHLRAGAGRIGQRVRLTTTELGTTSDGGSMSDFAFAAIGD